MPASGLPRRVTMQDPKPTMSEQDTEQQETIENILGLNERLLQSITDRDWETYGALCDPTLSSFEPESRGQLVEGMEFHRFYFEQGKRSPPSNTTICSPHVRLLGDSAVVCYVRLVQSFDDAGRHITHRFEETRVWHRQADGWHHVHFHRSTST
jgi:calcium/calmodulin-dependent protein kinase (CaM kinase) II